MDTPGNSDAVRPNFNELPLPERLAYAQRAIDETITADAEALRAQFTALQEQLQGCFDSLTRFCANDYHTDPEAPKGRFTDLSLAPLQKAERELHAAIRQRTILRLVGTGFDEQASAE